MAGIQKRMLKGWHPAFKERVLASKNQMLKNGYGIQKRMLKGCHARGMISAPKQVAVYIFLFLRTGIAHVFFEGLSEGVAS